MAIILTCDGGRNATRVAGMPPGDARNTRAGARQCAAFDDCIGMND
jgi:hypothetical protein